VKLGEVGAWLSRRNKNPIAVAQAVSRAWWRWNHRYVFPKNAGISAPLQLSAGLMLFFYVINYPKYRKHRFYKYH
jgi:F-type H+-transporting ATPase subunit f